MTLYKAPRGTQDILPDEQPYWQYVRQRIQAIAQLYGYQPMDVPLFEQTSIFVRGVGEGTDMVDKEMYSFRDRGGDELTLRPELTAGIVRAYLEHGMHVWPQPVKVYSIGPAFRYERPQAGRYRQHYQLSVEAIGEQDPALDAEVMSMAWHLYDHLGFQGLSLQLNSIGCPKCRPGYIRALRAYYNHHLEEICEDCHRRLEVNPLRVLDCKAESCQPIIAEAPHSTDFLCQECREHFSTLLGYLDRLGLPYTINHRLVRGLDYYTKTVFEVWAKGIGAQNAVCGGGRYDVLAESLGGDHAPGVGFGSGLERIILTMKQQDMKVPELPQPQVMILYLGQEAKEAALQLANELRLAGIRTETSFGDRSLRAQLRNADRAEVAYTCILGERELRSQQVAVKDMAAGGQQAVARDSVVDWLKTHLGMA
ncbi:MAG: histidine--tRNA ligase [Chloroflexota bacterium]|nr:histidine--tRNA ligase [Chloroflexota bacterium]